MVVANAQEADVNGDGTFDYEEFLAATINVGKLEREDHLKRAFEHFDLDGNGQISHDELVQVSWMEACACGALVWVCMLPCWACVWLCYAVRLAWARVLSCLPVLVTHGPCVATS